MAAAFDSIEQPFILEETGEYLVVFKPAGMHSVPKGEAADGKDLVSWLALEQPNTRRAFETGSDGGWSSELGMISRLDRGTSGIILFARTPALRRELFALASRGGIRKEYRLLASPSDRHLPGSMPGLKPLKLSCEAPQEAMAGYKDTAWMHIESFFRSYGEGGARVACIDPGRAEECRRRLTKKTYTTFIRAEGKASGAPDGAVIASARIDAGFRHQIRAHLAWSGFPIIGDRDYGGPDARRLFLEAHRITVDSAGSAEPVIFELYGTGHES